MERFLLPFLGEAQTDGCDIACGWGRGALTTAHRQPSLNIHCCDVSVESLQLLERLAKNDNIDRRIFTHSVDVNSLPLTDDSVDFILGFDIFELLPDEKLYPLLDEMLRIARVGAVSYLKITLHAYQPTLGQVQQFAPRKVRKLFEGRSCHGKRWELLLNDRRAPEHFTFQVVED